jgi:SAM-dependent MidA family methyltransferase
VGTPVRFDRFMHEALYGRDGWYTTGRGGAGRGGDFLTSVEVGPLFGAVTAVALDRWWHELSRPDPYVVVEAGAGRGQWCRAVRRAGPACGAALRWVAVEVSPSAAAASATTCDDVLASWPSTGVHVGLANELLDNLPVRVVDGRQELHVDAGRPVWSPGAEEHPTGPLPLAEAAAAWVTTAVRSLLAGGRLVCFDYGAPTAEFASRPLDTWLRTYVRHRRGGAPWEDPGYQDITCDVPWDQLPGPPGPVTQAEWLRAHGIDELVAEGRRTWSERAHLGDLAAVEARSRVGEAATLTDPAGMGAFLVMEWRAPAPTGGLNSAVPA